MLTTEIFTEEGYKVIYYRNSDGVAIRVLVLDLDGNVIQETLSEYASNGVLLTDVVYGSDFTTVIGYREYRYGAGASQRHGYSDYKLIDGILKKVQRTESHWIEKDRKARCDFYNADDELVFYELFEYDEDCGMVTQGVFDLEGNPYKGYPLPSYSLHY